MNIIGIDSGSSKIKIVEVNKKYEIINKMIIDKIATIKALDIFINQNKIDIKNIERVVLTGVGIVDEDKKFFKIPTHFIDEFTAIGYGGTFLTKKDKALVISIGTGTAFVKVNGKEITHIGGSGVGGGTFLKLCEKLTNINDIEKIKDLISQGNLNKVNLTIGDVSIKEIKTLPKDVTAVNLGKLNSKTNTQDVIIGILNMIVETLGMMAVFTVQNEDCKDVILTGTTMLLPKVKDFFKRIELLQNINFIVPEKPEFATILGAIKYAKLV